MGDARQNRRNYGDWLLFAMCLTVLAGLPAAVVMHTEADLARSSMARPRDAVIISTPVRLRTQLPISIDSGVLHGPDQATWRDKAQLARLEVDSAAFTLDLSGNSRPLDGNGADQTEFERALQHLSSLNARSITLRRSTVDILRGTEKPIRLAGVAAEITATGRESFVAKGTAHYRGFPISFEASWSLPSDLKAPAVYPIKISIGGRALEARIDGRLDLTGPPRLEGRGDMRSAKVRQLLRWLGLPVAPGNDLRSGSIAGDFTWGRSGLSFSKSTITIDGNEAVGSLLITFADKRPKLDGTLAFKTFGAGRYIGDLLAEPPRLEPASTERLHSILALIDADLRLSASKIAAPYFELGRGALTVALKNGRLLADLAELEIEGGSLTGQLSLDVTASEPRLGLKLRAKQVDPGRALTDIMKRNPLLGRANVTFEATSMGHTLTELVQAMQGRGTFELIDSGRLNLDLKALVHVAPAETASGWAAAGKGYTALTGLDARFALTKGDLQVETIVARAGPVTYLGTGRLDLGNRLIDLSIAHNGGVPTESPITNREVLRLHGPWAQPLIGVHQAPPALSTIPHVKGSSIRTPGVIEDARTRPLAPTIERTSQPAAATLP